LRGMVELKDGGLQAVIRVRTEFGCMHLMLSANFALKRGNRVLRLVDLLF
jgi:hypothetical protein